ncbi:hypothetical protein PENVUL_c005G04189 [Penicillium vulpinum]|uniref:Microbial-type PARG catalytic domain-containing protein n=2 Tax=Penicillium vulpinum TaxID=29845 RepID=A0A1V6S712_9EURO|nr:hypothetical protein PENVUL_c005G04189 [Penicillium vulpinum]
MTYGPSDNNMTSSGSSSGFSLIPGSEADALRKKHPAQKPVLTKKQPPGFFKIKGSGVKKFKTTSATMRKVIEATQKATLEILSKTELQGTRFGYIANRWTSFPLRPSHVEYPNQTTVVRVVAGDTYDQALAMHYAGNTIDRMPVCVLNFANAHTPGGGWLHGARAQEEQLCYRSTLNGTLHTNFYPITDMECLYSPNVIVFRTSVDKGYDFLSSEDKLHLNPSVSVISMPARSKPKLTADNSTYQDEGHRLLMKGKMQLILRTAALHNHRRLVLGAIGCGAFRHPPQEVANCWRDVLAKKEFKGWFEQIHFVIRDAPGENNFAIFTKTLDGMKMKIT